MLLFLAALVVTVGVFVSPSAADTPEHFIADAPEQVRPLLIGDHIPDVTLLTPSYRPVVLRDALAKQPTILIYYRGGW